MLAMGSPPPFALPPEPAFPALPPGAEAVRRLCLPAPQLQGRPFEEPLASPAAASRAPLARASGRLAASEPPAPPCPEPEPEPRQLEAFAERFKQRRVKLGVTQADVGAALARLKLPGVGSLSQSTICRFESLTLSPNNMLALRPVLQAWLEEAEAGARPPLPGGAERKRKRTSIGGPEKRSLEAYFALQPRPSADKIAAIAGKLELQKSVVRVWFCNQRQKQKRMKYAAAR